MMNPKIIRVDLENKDFSIISDSGSERYLGGEPLAFYLLGEKIERPFKNENYLSISSGPINGLFPYTSKSVILHLSKGLLLSKYVGGGAIGALMKLSNIVSIELLGDAKKPTYLDITPKGVNFIDVSDELNTKEYGLTGRRSTIIFKKTILSDGYFNFGRPKNDISNNLYGLTFSTQGEISLPDMDSYWEVVSLVNSKIGELSVGKSGNHSCFGCPMGCAMSGTPETGNVSLLPRSLVACAYAESIYSDISTVFSCLSVLGYNYKHEFLESFSDMAGDMIKNTYNKIESIKVKNSITGII